MLKITAAFLAALVVALPAWAADGKPDDKDNAADRTFVEKASMGNQMEVKLSEMAVKSASRADVKRFAQKLMDDHTRAKQMMADILAKKTIKAPADEAKEFKEVSERLSAAKGAEFDAAYLQQMVKSHEEVVKLYENYAKEGNDPDLKKFAAGMLPTVKDHLEMAKKLAAQKGDK